MTRDEILNDVIRQTKYMLDRSQCFYCNAECGNTETIFINYCQGVRDAYQAVYDYLTDLKSCLEEERMKHDENRN